MGMHLVKAQLPGPVQPFDKCYNSAVSFHFDIEPGCQGEIRIHKLPPNACLCVEEYVYSCCCTVVEQYPVLDDCGCPLCTDECGSICVGSGRFHLVLTDKETEEPLIPDENDISVTVQHKLA